MSKKQKIDPDYFLALALQKKFNEEYKKEKNEKDLASPARKKPMTDRPTTFSGPNRPLPFSKPIPSDNAAKPSWSKRPSPDKYSTPSTNRPLSSTPVKFSTPSTSKAFSASPAKFSSSQSTSLNDSQWEVIDPTPDVHGLFVAFGRRFFQDRLGSVEVKWSKRMTSCAGVCRFKGRRDRFGRGIGEVTISLSEPLLKLRPRSDLVNTLLHEMIHAYLFLFTENPNRADRDDHGQEFQQHMHRINKAAGTKITIYHSFHDEVKLYKQHWWQCDGPCKSRGPFFGLVKRATNRAPGKYDFWYATHQAECGGKFIKIKEPDNFKARPRKNKENFSGSSGGGSQIGGIGGNQRAIGGPSTSSSGGNTSNIRGFGQTNNTNYKHLPTPGQPKIVGFVDLNKSPSGASHQSNPSGKTDRPNSTVGKPGVGNTKPGNSSGSTGGYTLGTSTRNGGNTLGGTLGSVKDNDGFYKLGTPLNKPHLMRSPNGTLSSPSSGNKPNSSVSRPTNSNRPVNPIGSKLLDKLKFDSQSGSNRSSSSSRGFGNNNGGLGTNVRGSLGSNFMSGMSNNSSSGMGDNSRGGFAGGGTRMNKGSGTMVLNPTKAATAQPNETAERITKPINKTEENKLNLDLFKPFTGQGQTLGGGSTIPDKTKSRLLVTSTSGNIGGNSSRDSRDGITKTRDDSNLRDKSRTDRDNSRIDRSISKNYREHTRNDRDNTRNYIDNTRNYRDNSRNNRDDSRNGRDNNKKVCLGNRSLYSNEPSTSHSKAQSPNEDFSGSKNSPKNQSNTDHLKWELGDAEMEDDYEYKKLNSSFSKDKSILNLDDSFEEMEKMMNDTDVDVFESISDETLNGTPNRTKDWANSGNNDNSRSLDQTESTDNARPIFNSENNDSLDDIFEISSEEDPDDETHCPVCSKAIARARMHEHLENCMELSQVFDNVAFDEDDDEQGDSDDVVKNDRSTGSSVNENDKMFRNNERGLFNDDVTMENDEKYHDNRHDGNFVNMSNRNDKTSIRKNDRNSQHNNDDVKNANKNDVNALDNDDLATINANRFARIAGYRDSTRQDNNDVAVENANRYDLINDNKLKTSDNHATLNNANRNGDAKDKSSDIATKKDNVSRTDDTSDGVDGLSGMVKCPICNADIMETMVNEHIDECLARNISLEMD